jgi:hypothetical protein
MDRSGRIARGLALGVGLAAALAVPAGACTTTASPRPVADYRAASIVVLGTLVGAEPDLVVDVTTTYRGFETARVTLARPDQVTWCPFPFGVPRVGEQVLLAVVDETDWQWPNSATWVIDAEGRIVDPSTPWADAPVPTTLDEALRTMGIAPDTATLGESDALPGSPLPPWWPIAALVGLAGSAIWIRRFGPERSARAG